MLTQQLDEITYKKDEMFNIISILMQRNANEKENNERIVIRIITDLKTNLEKQIDKLSTLFSKDTLITDYPNTIKLVYTLLIYLLIYF